jgi:soluble lytic murein transglycosylase
VFWPKISWALTPQAKRKIGAILGTLFLLLLVVSSNWFWRLIYPIHHEALIRQVAATQGVDPMLVAALIRVESNFQEEGRSHVGAVGLMQLMPETAKWIAGQIGVTWQTESDLEDPELNIRMGTWYLSHLSKQYQGNWVTGVAAYNAGPGRVSSWLKADVWDGQLETAGKIPVGETRHYVQRVFYYYDKYKKVYEE